MAKLTLEQDSYCKQVAEELNQIYPFDEENERMFGKNYTYKSIKSDLTGGTTISLNHFVNEIQDRHPKRDLVNKTLPKLYGLIETVQKTISTSATRKAMIYNSNRIYTPSAIMNENEAIANDVALLIQGEINNKKEIENCAFFEKIINDVKNNNDTFANHFMVIGGNSLVIDGVHFGEYNSSGEISNNYLVVPNANNSNSLTMEQKKVYLDFKNSLNSVIVNDTKKGFNDKDGISSNVLKWFIKNHNMTLEEKVDKARQYIVGVEEDDLGLKSLSLYDMNTDKVFSYDMLPMTMMMKSIDKYGNNYASRTRGKYLNYEIDFSKETINLNFNIENKAEIKEISFKDFGFMNAFPSVIKEQKRDAWDSKNHIQFAHAEAVNKELTEQIKTTVEYGIKTRNVIQKLEEINMAVPDASDLINNLPSNQDTFTLNDIQKAFGKAIIFAQEKVERGTGKQIENIKGLELGE